MRARPAVRQPGRLRHALRPPQRRAGFYARAARARRAGCPRFASALGPGDVRVHHRRPRQRPDVRPAPTTRASACRCSPSARRAARRPRRRARRFCDLGADASRPSLGVAAAAARRELPGSIAHGRVGRAVKRAGHRPDAVADRAQARRRRAGRRRDRRAHRGGAAGGTIPDYQAAALLMAIFWRGLDDARAGDLDRAMIALGRSLACSASAGRKVDKHSTGGVGDKISLCLAPLVAALRRRRADDLGARPRPHRRHARQAGGDPRLSRRTSTTLRSSPCARRAAPRRADRRLAPADRGSTRCAT